MFTKAELEMIARTIIACADSHFTIACIDRPDAIEIVKSIGNNAAMGVAEVIHTILPEIDDDLQASARSSVWAGASEVNSAPCARAGISPFAADSLKLVLSNGMNPDVALAELERKLFAFFLAVRRLRRLPAECLYTHRLDPNTGACERCGERPEQ